MSDIESSNYSETAANNTAASPNGWPANSPPTIVYAADREMMGATKREWNRSHPTVTSSGTNTVTLTYTTAPAALVQGQMYSFIVGATNTGAATLNVNSLGAKSIFMDGKALVGGEMVANSVILLFYDGTQYQIVSSRAIGALPLSNKNWVINGDQEIWQRGAGGSASIAVPAATGATYASDRFYTITGSSQATTISQQTGLTNGSLYCARVQRNSGQTGTSTMLYASPFELASIAALRGSIVTISARVRSGANFSPTSGALSVILYGGTGAAGKRGSTPYTNEVTIVSATANLGTSSSVTLLSGTSAAVVATNTTQMEVSFQWTPTGTASTNDYIEIDEVQLEIAGLATTFDRRGFSDELARCQRFYQKSFNYGTAPAQSAGTTGATLGAPVVAGAVGESLPIQLFTRMRTNPSYTLYNPSASNAQLRNLSKSTDATSTAAAGNGEQAFQVTATGAAGWAVGDTYAIQWQADAEL